MKLNLVGSFTDWEKLEKLKKERWSVAGKQSAEIVFCKEHNTFFLEKDEPCWECFDECNVKIT